MYRVSEKENIGIHAILAMIYFIALPLTNVIFAAGHYKETKFGAYMEVLLNTGISLLLVNRLGMCGVAIGTLIAMFSRTVYIAWYLSKNITKRSFWLFVKNAGLNFFVSVATIYVFQQNFEIST